jgi:catechol 2,3-dioxygenase-like lactoylglutathione lyase family enzyme
VTSSWRTVTFVRRLCLNLANAPDSALETCSVVGHTRAVKTAGVIQHISAVTFAVHDMAQSIDFYKKLGFELLYGGDRAAFSTLKAGEAFVNLLASSEYEHRWWGRAIFRVDSVDAHYRLLCERGLKPPFPRDAPWGERLFHLNDPDGHELSFAELLARQA